MAAIWCKPQYWHNGEERSLLMSSRLNVVSVNMQPTLLRPTSATRWSLHQRGGPATQHTRMTIEQFSNLSRLAQEIALAESTSFCLSFFDTLLICNCSLAYVEMRIILAKLLWQFDVALAGPDQDWIGSQKCFPLWQKIPLMVKLTPVDR